MCRRKTFWLFNENARSILVFFLIKTDGAEILKGGKNKMAGL